METKIYSEKTFCGYTLIDKWNLKEHPLYIGFNSKKEFPYFDIDEVYFDGSTEVSSLTGITNFYKKHEWFFNKPFLKKRNEQIEFTMSLLEIVWTP